MEASVRLRQQRRRTRPSLPLLALLAGLCTSPRAGAQEPSQVFRFDFKRPMRIDVYFTGIFTGHADRYRLISLIDFKRPGLYLAKRLAVARDWDRAMLETHKYFRDRISKWQLPPPDTVPFNASLACADEAVRNIVTLPGSSGGGGPVRVDFGPGGIRWGSEGNPLWKAGHKDMQWLWQLHRAPFWMSLAEAYRRTQREAYFTAFRAQFEGWLAANPRDPRYDYDLGGRFKLTPAHEWTTAQSIWPNPHHPKLSWAWRRQDVAHRLILFPYLIRAFAPAQGFTRAFLVLLLNSMHEHAQFLSANPYSNLPLNTREDGLVEAVAVAAAGTLVPEFFDAFTWRGRAFAHMRQQLRTFVDPDGMVTSIPAELYLRLRRFYDVPRLAHTGGLSTFGRWYWAAVQRMATALISIGLPLGGRTLPAFGAALDPLGPGGGFATSMRSLGVFFGRKDLLYFAGDPEYRSFMTDQPDVALLHAGLYVMRSDWSPDATLLVTRCGPTPTARGHRDAATFDLFYRGQSLTPDSGGSSHGAAQRMGDAGSSQYLASTMAHNALTLDGMDAHQPSVEAGPFKQAGGYHDCGLLLWSPQHERDDDNSVLVVENLRTYQDPDLSHRRTVVFVQRRFFVFVDEALGEAKGDIGLHFQLRNCSYELLATQGVATVCPDGRNVLVQRVSVHPDASPVQVDVGWLSVAPGSKVKRPRATFRHAKGDDATVTFYTAVVPFTGPKAPTVSARVEARQQHVEAVQVNLTVEVDAEVHTVEYLYNPQDFKQPEPSPATVSNPQWRPSPAQKLFYAAFRRFAAGRSPTSALGLDPSPQFNVSAPDDSADGEEPPATAMAVPATAHDYDDDD